MGAREKAVVEIVNKIVSKYYEILNISDAIFKKYINKSSLKGLLPTLTM